MSSANPDYRRVRLGEQTIGSITATIAYIYRRHFHTIVGCALLPYAAPVGLFVAVVEIQALQNGPIYTVLMGWILALFFYSTFMLVPAAATAVLSDISRGKVPTVQRAYARVFRNGGWWHVATTGILTTLLLVGLGRSFFTITVSVIEGRHNFSALQRSMELTQGQWWRITLMFVLVMLGCIVVPLVLLVAVAILFFNTPSELNGICGVIALLIVGSAVPTPAITLALLYFDQRARREGYNPQILNEELMR